MRTGLPDGAVIMLNHDGTSRAFRMEHTIGEGASCIAYEATLVDGSNAGLRCRVKECYPYHAAITRRGSTLVWESGDERERAFQKLRTTHELLLSLRNDDEIGDSIVSSSLYEGNGTLYMVMELNHAVTYDKDSDVSLHEMLDTIRVLATHVGQLHRMGYLHLDIKPGNFLVRHHPSTAVWLFDVDSFTSIQEIASGHAVSYPYSRGCAAPEQLCGKTRKLCPATDIFAIGAVLFMKIMGRPVCNEDMGLFADWAFDGEPFDSVNPKVKRILKEIFHKTLAASPSRRFQTVDELLRTIKAALDVTIEGKPYLRSSGISNTIRFVGREKEISRIHEAFAEGKHAVFLHGEGGMGKSCTAIAYGEAYRDEYDVVIFLRYRDSLQETLNRIEICNFDGGNDKEREQTLRRLLDNHVLLIIDNFDVEIDQDEYLPELIDYPAHILITSRTDFASAYEGSVAQIEVGRLTDAQALDIFAHAGRLDAQTLAHSEGYAKLCRRVEYNTLLLELMGRQCAASCISADELWQQMKPGLNQSERMEKVWTQKDGRRTRQTIYSVLRVLYDVASLSESRQRALQNLCVLRFLDVDRAAYFRFTYTETMDALNELVELGWVQRRGQFFALNSLIEELVQHDLLPNTEYCDAVCRIRDLIRDTLELRKEYAGGHSEYEYEYYSRILCAFAVSANLQNATMRQMVFQWLNGLMTVTEDDWLDSNIGLPSPMDERYGRLYAKLADLAETCDLTDGEVADIRCICFVAWASCYCCHVGYQDREKYCWECDEGSRLAYSALMDFLNSAPSHLVGEVVDRIAQYLSFVNPYPPVEYVRSLYSLSPRAFDPYEELREKYGLPLSSEQQRGWGIPQKREELWRRSLHYEQVEPYINAYLAASDKRDYIERLMQDESLSLGKRAEMISECIGAVFYDPEKGLHQRYRQIDWEEQVELLEMEEAFLFDDAWKGSPDEDGFDRFLAVRYNTMNQAAAYARLGRVDDFENCVTYIFSLMKDRAQSEPESNRSFGSMIDDGMFFCNEMYGAAHRLYEVDRACYAVPMLHTYIEGWLEYARKLPTFDADHEYAFVPLYSGFISYLKAASTEDNIPAQYQMPYDEMIAEYKRRVAELTDTGYRIRAPKEE